MQLSSSQKLMKKISSESYFTAAMEESEKWRFTCECGKESSIWEIGGVRYKAKGSPVKFLKCPHCEKKSMMKIYKV